MVFKDCTQIWIKFIYLFSEGVNYTYDLSGEILEITATQVRISGDFIENSTGGYINHHKNY